MIFLYPLLFNKFYSFRDTTIYVIPLKHFLISEIKGGKIPWWNPYNGGGEYFLANPQVNLFYPLSYLFLLPPHIAFQLFQYFQILICFLGVYLLSRSFQKSELQAVSYGFSIIFSGFFLSLWDLPFEMGCISFSFLCLWALKENKMKHFILFLSLMFFSGEPFTFLLFLFFLIFFIISERIQFSKLLNPLLLFMVFSSGIILLSFNILIFSTRTQKETLIFEGIGIKKILSLAGGSASFYNLNEYTYLPVLFFGTFLFSNFLSGLFSKSKKIYLIPFLFFLILSSGTSGFFNFFYSFPPFSLLRYPSRFLPLCLLPMLLISFEKRKNFLAFLIHLFLIFLSFIFFLPKSLIFAIPVLSLILIFFLKENSKFLIFIPLLDLIISLPLFTIQNLRIPELPFKFKNPALFRVYVPDKDINYIRYLYPANSFTKESDFKGILALDSYTNLFYPVSTSYTPHPFPPKKYKDFSKKEDFLISCQYFGFIDKDGLKWQKLKSKNLVEPEVENFKLKGDGFEFKLILKEEKEIILRFLKLPYTKVLANGEKIPVEKEENWIKFKLKEGNYLIKVNFTPLFLKIFYFLSLIAWILFLCYFIIKWITSLFSSSA